MSQILVHPFFWDDTKKLLFLKDASERFEIEDANAVIVQTVETEAEEVVGTDWGTKLDQFLIDNLGKYRKYNFGAVRDLLRVIRNKSHHYRGQKYPNITHTDLPLEVQQALGPLPDGFLGYFLSRYPKLFMHTVSSS